MENRGNHIESLSVEQVREQVMVELTRECAQNGFTRPVIAAAIDAFGWALVILPEELQSMLDECRALLALILCYAGE